MLLRDPPIFITGLKASCLAGELVPSGVGVWVDYTLHEYPET